MFYHKKAVTLIELIFVIVIIGILSAVIAPSFTRPTLVEAANQVVSHIRYTQHLAMIDNKFNPTDEFWYRERWKIQFGKSKTRTRHTNDEYAYSIYSDKIGFSGGHSGKPNLTEMAKNPLNSSQYLSGGFSGSLHYKDKRAMKTLNIGIKYGIRDVKFKNGCSRGTGIAFDYLGRPIRGDISKMDKAYTITNIINNQCKIYLCLDRPCDLTDKDKHIVIAIEPETGYTHIL